MNYGTVSDTIRLPSSSVDRFQMASSTTPQMPIPDTPGDPAIRGLDEAGIESILQHPPSHIWREFLEARLRKKDLRQFRQRLDPDMTVDRIHSLFEQHRRPRPDCRYLAAMEPIVEGLFHQAQAVACLFKAAHKVLSAKNYRKILSHISTFLQGLTNLLPRLGEAWKNMLRGIFMPGTDYRDFADAVDKLERYQVTIDREVQLALLQEHRGLSSRQIEDGQYERADRACTG
ncbi:hypothetical protein BBK36DRAFT_1163804 [Trichoderma citrinoviride]|uniref:Uncharacterized protein n=1 Tax=Trichoderma citrinoviride TaxID=58853 RepID=A0A2T4AX19_9HYPO|nr:hypothetical protein BBK36DRAFT_1163804 [Trichoderma citrinoviride]PTB61612.1 hypothetical protein BBK36DRAFT_1163804 [Trichoderma citrinoviride]